LLSISRRTCLLMAGSALALFSSACFLIKGEPTNFFVREIKINNRQQLIPIGPKSPRHFDDGSYYMFFYAATGITSVSHWLTLAPTGKHRQLMYLESNKDGLFDRTVKTDRIIAGPFGAVVTERTCFYNRPVTTSPSALLVQVQGMKYDIAEIPDTISELPKDAPPLTSFAIIRFFRAGGDLTFGSGNYEATGAIGAIQSGKISDGDRLPGASTAFPEAPSFNNLQHIYGLSSHVNIADYLRSNRIALAATSNTDDRSFVILVYGFGKFIRQDSLGKGGVVASSRLLRPLVTEEEKILGPECDDRFRKQQETGESTVW
jgi:hypothetical protein